MCIGLSHTPLPHPFLPLLSANAPDPDVLAQSDRKSAGMPKSRAHIRRHALRHHGSISVCYGRTAACAAHRLPVSTIELFDTRARSAVGCAYFLLLLMVGCFWLLLLLMLSDSPCSCERVVRAFCVRIEIVW